MAANPKLADFARRALFDDTCAARLAVQGSNLMGRGTASFIVRQFKGQGIKKLGF